MDKSITRPFASDVWRHERTRGKVHYSSGYIYEGMVVNELHVALEDWYQRNKRDAIHQQVDLAQTPLPRAADKSLQRLMHKAIALGIGGESCEKQVEDHSAELLQAVQKSQ